MFKLILSKLPKKSSKSSGNQEFHAAFAPVLDSAKSSKGNPINKSLSTLYSASNLGDYHLDNLPVGVNSNLNGISVDAYEALPGFREVLSSEKQNLFIRKLKMCCILFDFSNPNKNLKEKEIKRQTLLELLEYITSANVKFSDSIIEEAIKMVSANIFRSFSPQPRDNVLGAYDSEEDEPFGDPAWPHLQIVYEFLLIFVASPETDANSAKKYIDHFFVLNLLDLFDSEDPREREYLKNILHRVYGKFMVHRPFIWTCMNNIFYTFIFETEKHNGIAELLEILGSFINGFSLPLKGEHNLFLVRALIPLHKPRCLGMYHKQLSYCISQFVEKDCKLADNVIRGLLKYWPISSSSKELMFLEELEEVLDATQPPEFQGCMVPLFQQIARCLNSLHFQVAERALCLWNNDHIYNLIDQNHDVILPIVFPAVERNARSHWNESVHSLTVVIRKIFFGLDPELFEECLIKFQDDKYKEEAVKAKREAMWRRLERIASKKPATNEAVLLSF